MIKISKKQRNYLLNNRVNDKFYAEDIHHTHGHHKKYYVTTSRWVMDALYKMEKESVIYTKTKQVATA